MTLPDDAIDQIKRMIDAPRQPSMFFVSAASAPWLRPLPPPTVKTYRGGLSKQQRRQRRSAETARWAYRFVLQPPPILLIADLMVEVGAKTYTLYSSTDGGTCTARLAWYEGSVLSAQVRRESASGETAAEAVANLRAKVTR